MKRFFALLIMTASASGLRAGEAAWARTDIATALNPRISVIGDFLARTGTPGQAEDGFSVREVEIGIQADVDPYARADFFLGGLNSDGGSLELEEGYVTLLALPLGLQGRGGKFKANYGRLNMVHPHEYPQVDQPLALEAFYGGGGINAPGLEVSRIFAPLGVFTELTYAFLQNLGGGHGHDHGHGGDAHTVVITVTDTVSGLPVEIPLEVEEEEPAGRIGNFAHAAKVRFYRDLSDDLNLDLGVSGAIHQPQDVSGTPETDFDRKRFGAVDLTLRWKPLRRGTYRSAVWRTEVHYTDQKLAPEIHPITGDVEEPAARVYRRGGYSYLEVQPARRWRTGVRGDYAEDPEVRSRDVPHITRAVSPYVTFTLTEFNRFRLQYTRKDLPGGETQDLGYLQWTVVLGPHGAHPF